MIQRQSSLEQDTHTYRWKRRYPHAETPEVKPESLLRSSCSRTHIRRREWIFLLLLPLYCCGQDNVRTNRVQNMIPCNHRDQTHTTTNQQKATTHRTVQKEPSCVCTQRSCSTGTHTHTTHTHTAHTVSQQSRSEPASHARQVARAPAHA